MKNGLVIKLQKGDEWVLVINFLLAVFLITKMIRGIGISNSVGGIWNYIQLIFIAWGFALVLSHKQKVRVSSPIKLSLRYSFLAFVFALLHIPALTMGSMYSMAMILYPGLFLYVIYSCYKQRKNVNNKLIVIAFYIIAILFMRTQIRYYNGLTTRATISNAYYVLALLPFVLLMTPLRRRILPLIVAFSTLVLSAKRAGFIGLILGITVYYLILSIKQRRITTFIKYFTVSVLVIIALYYATNLLDQRFNINFISRLLRTLDDGGSGRDVRWNTVIDAIRNSNVIQLLFGHGNDSISATIGNAHNDFLQVLYENGIFVLAVYISYYTSLIRILIQMTRENYDYAPELGMSIVISLSLALFSFYIVEGTFITCGLLTQGYILACWDLDRNRSLVSKNEEAISYGTS